MLLRQSPRMLCAVNNLQNPGEPVAALDVTDVYKVTQALREIRDGNVPQKM
jgi:hypothetical protein